MRRTEGMDEFLYSQCTECAGQGRGVCSYPDQCGSNRISPSLDFSWGQAPSLPVASRKGDCILGSKGQSSWLKAVTTVLYPAPVMASVLCCVLLRNQLI